MLPPFHYNEGGSGAVLKIVPIDGEVLVNGEAQTKSQDMMSEIEILHQLCRIGESGAAPNFVKVRDVFLTKGNYQKSDIMCIILKVSISFFSK